MEHNEKPQPVSRSEAVRRALDAGHEAAEEGVAFIRKEFGIELSPSLFLAAKATERKKGWAKSGKPGRKSKQVADERDDRGDDEDELIG